MKHPTQYYRLGRLWTVDCGLWTVDCRLWTMVTGEHIPITQTEVKDPPVRERTPLGANLPAHLHTSSSFT